MSRSTTLQIVFAVFLMAASSSAQDVLYGSDVQLDDLGSIDRTTAAWTTIGSQSTVGAITGLAYDPVQDVLYGCSPNNNSVYTVDQTNGSISLVGPTGFSNINGLAYDPNSGTLYCTDLNGNAFFTVDTNTGAGTLIATLSGAMAVEGLAYDPVANVLYGLDDIADAVVIINPATGVASALPSGIGSPGIWRGLTWDSTLGVIWATRVNPGQLWMVDPTTGAGTFIGAPTTFVQGLAFKGGSGSPNYQVNQAQASLTLNGVMGTPSAVALVNLGIGQAGTLAFAGSNVGQLWELGVGQAPLVSATQGAFITGDGEIVNLDLADPTLSFLWNSFQSPPFAPFSLAVSFPAATTLSAQMAITDPASVSGFRLTQPTRLIVQ